MKTLSRTEMKLVAGGNSGTCLKHVVCVQSDNMTEDHYYTVCCTTLSQAMSYCYSHGYSGIYGCIGDIEES